MKRALIVVFVAVLGIIGVFVYSNLRPNISPVVSAACRQERLQGLTCVPSGVGFQREGLIG
jgi:hypothetical protein